LLQKSGSWRGSGDVSCWRDMICSDGVAEDSENMGIFNRIQFRQFLFSRFEKWRIVNVSRVIVPLEMD
jgi:hypothetical protein